MQSLTIRCYLKRFSKSVSPLTLLLLLILFSGFRDFLETDEDPTEVHHVNVISGKLHLVSEDHVVNGAIPLPVIRTYGNHLLKMQSPIGKKIGPGWNLLPHMFLRLYPEETKCRALINEPSGRLVTYQGEYKRNGWLILKPSKKQNHIARGYREDIGNHTLYLDYKNGKAVLDLADGGKRIYQGDPKSFHDKIADYVPMFKRNQQNYLLQKEIHPSGFKTVYRYSNGDKNVRVSQMNYSETKTYNCICIQEIEDSIQISTSDGQKYEYHQDYTKSFTGPLEKISYIHHKGMLESPYLERIKATGQAPLQVEYYFPTRDQQQLYKDLASRPIEAYKVKTIFEKGERVAFFTYHPTYTDVLNSDDVLTRYHHREGVLTQIEYFDKNRELYSLEEFIWNGDRLFSRSLYHPDKTLVFSKEFLYDEYGNTVQETLIGNIKGDSLNESYSKRYSYNNNHLLVEEREESGLLYCYDYLEETDLLIKKSVFANNEWVFEETYKYDEDRLLIEKKIRDEKHETIEHLTRDSKKGVVIKKETGLNTIYYNYDKKLRLISEEINGYKSNLDYDLAGRVIKKTSLLGRASTYTYDTFSNLIQIKEVGSPEKQIFYDPCNRPICCIQNNKESSIIYDSRGRVVLETDYKKNETHFLYDEFSRCIEKILPNGAIFEYDYDMQGNVVFEKAPNGRETKTSYTIFKKPCHITKADGTEIFHFYNSSGSLIETIHEDSTKTSYTYDPLQRLISKKERGFEEKWEYEGLLLRSYIDQSGLKTIYEYDDYGRKIRENREGRIQLFHYDRFGYLERIEEGDLYQVEVHDVEGNIIETNQNGFQNTKYLYDSEGRKVKVIKGPAEDTFKYDNEGRLILHRDPLGQEMRFIFDDFRKIAIDPLGNQTIETFNRFSELVQIEKKSPSGETFFKETFTYNEMGELIKRVTEGKTVLFQRDILGQLIEERESSEKAISYEYDIKGRLIKKRLPSGVELSYRYDERDRLAECISSDGSISYEYIYDGIYLIKVIDHLLQKEIKRSYTPFGELKQEIGLFGHKLSWDRDQYGRTTRLTLPDGSSIDYTYENSSMKSISRLSSDKKLLYRHTYTKFDTNQHVEEETMGDLGSIYSKRDLLERSYKTVSPYHQIELAYNPSGFITKNHRTLTGDKEYSYDSLGQLIQENQTSYAFDALGNPKECVINDLNQIVLAGSEAFEYDKNGNLTSRNRIHYVYDALNRLREIHYEDGKIIRYTYDPFSRLIGKENHYYLYDEENEIGRINQKGKIDQLRVLGLGVKGEIGAAVLIECNNNRYIPLHDLQGNIIACLDEEGDIVESYDYNAFGEEEREDYINPWRFSSKRHDEGLIFFTYRFYDPKLKRFITPDPAGFVDGVNLYVYTLNSPTNRLDLFGLESEVWFTIPGKENKEFANPYPKTWLNYPTPTRWIGTANLSGRLTEIMIICSRKYILHFTPDEIEAGRFNLFDHLPDLLENVENQISLATFQNGINTSVKDWMSASHVLANDLPQGTLFISLYNPTDGIFRDILRTFREKSGSETYGTESLNELHTTLLDLLDTHAPNAKALHIAHSEAGVIYNRSFESMTDKQRMKMQQYFYCKGIGPAEPIPQKYGIDSVNTYSRHDFITGLFAKWSNQQCKVEWIPAITPLHQRTMFFADHGLLGETYRKDFREFVNDLNKKRGFYVGHHR